MPRYKLTIEYDGRPFVGWQVQDNGPSVQGVLTAAIEAFCGEKASVHGAGRTDAGVHALGQVAHFDTHASRTLRGWVLGANSELPHDVAPVSYTHLRAHETLTSAGSSLLAPSTQPRMLRRACVSKCATWPCA